MLRKSNYSEVLLNIGWIYRTALVSLTFLIDIFKYFNYFAPAWQNKMKYVGFRELKKPNLGINISAQNKAIHLKRQETI